MNKLTLSITTGPIVGDNQRVPFCDIFLTSRTAVFNNSIINGVVGLR